MRLALGIGMALLLAVPAPLEGAEQEPIKKEPPEAAIAMLQKLREKAGDLPRFEAEFWIVELDHDLGQEKRGRGHIYFESPSEAAMEARPIALLQKQSRHRDPSGRERSYTIENIEPATWLWKNATLTAISERDHTYSSGKLEWAGSSHGTWSGLSYPILHPRCCLPVWLDPEFDFSRVKSRYRFVDVKSNTSAIAFRMVHVDCRDPIVRWDWCDRLAFESDHTLLFDRRTGLPTQWTERPNGIASEAD